MRMTKFGWLPVFAVMTAWGLSPAFGQAETPSPTLTPAEAWVITNSLAQVRPGNSMSDLRHHLEARFLSADLDGSGDITQKDNELSQQVAAAHRRAGIVSPWLLWDLDGDGRVTREEVVIAHGRRTAGPVRIGSIPVMPTPAQRKEALDRLVAKAMEADGDGDGIITFAEILEHANARVAEISARGFGMRGLEFPSSFDANNDGTTERAEYMAVVERVLSRIDSDGDGTISVQELEAHKSLRKAAQDLRRQERSFR